jgi:hypothetical protein
MGGIPQSNGSRNYKVKAKAQPQQKITVAWKPWDDTARVTFGNFVSDQWHWHIFKTDDDDLLMVLEKLYTSNFSTLGKPRPKAAASDAGGTS